ncbi:MAG: hypothetical protein ACOX6T_18710 [Myxococcales bacterium]
MSSNRPPNFNRRSIFCDPPSPHNARMEMQIREQGVQRQLDRMILINMTLWSFIQEKLGVTDKEFIARMREIDLSDGTLDGTFKKTAMLCVECARTIPINQRRCLYCGAEQPPATPFEAP